MLYFYSTRQSNPENKKYVEKTLKNKKVKVHEFINAGEYSLTQAYNIALDMADDDEIVVLAHDDINLEFGWDEKIESLFQNSDYGIIGVAGTASLPKSCVWWENRADLCGIVSHEKKENGKIIRYDSKFSEKHDFLMDVVVLDGVFIAIKKNRIKQKFNEKITGFHFYDISFCLDNWLEGVKIAVTTAIKVHHKSIGTLTQQWYDNRKLFNSLYEQYLPSVTQPSIEQIAKMKKVKLFSITIAVVILTKDKIDYLISCVDSILKNTAKEIKLNIYIGDTGSTPESLSKLNNYVDYVKNVENINIKIIPILKYNFAKNNNQIVKEHLENEELVLFCNNDIKLVNNALDLMVMYYQRNKNSVGTIGCRLIYENNRVQHGGIVLYAHENRLVSATHLGLKTYYWGKSNINYDVLGCTGAFLLINRELFQKTGGFNEDTIECFEDVILNLDMIIRKRKNFYVGEAVCYHYESITRNENPDQMQRINRDYLEVLVPKVKQNLNSLKKYLTFIQ